VGISRHELLSSLAKQRELLAESIVLTPVDSLSFSLPDRAHTAFLHGLYLTDKVRDREASREAVIQFGGRSAAAEDIAAIHRLLAETLGAAEGSLRLLAGLQAHAATFMSISTAGQSVMLLPAEAGGHFSTHAILHRLGLTTIDIPIDFERLAVDREATLRLVEQRRPEFVFIDRSEGLRYEDFSFLGELSGPVKIFDASQYVTPIITKRYENPLAWGFDLMLFTLHKSFPGPQKAGIVSRKSGPLWDQVVKGLSGLVSSSHAENTYLVGLALLRDDWLEAYATRLLETASALEWELGRLGVPVVPRARQGEAGWPTTHHIWITASGRDEAFSQYENLTAAGVHVNYRKLPYRLGYGLRLGTAFSATAGIGVGHIEELAEILSTAIQEDVGASLRGRVRDLASSARQDAILAPAHWEAV
jgi:glycine hydroxymethyltransferase